MTIPVIDKGTYLRGLLILARMDKTISETDEHIIKETARHFGYSSEFCEEIINTLLVNEYICTDPIKFRNTELARHFILDAVKVACNGKKLNPDEFQWLVETASLNRIDIIWLEREIDNYYNLINISYSALAVHSFE